MSNPDATITVPSHRGRSQAPTLRSSNHSASISDEEDGVPIDSPTDSHSYSEHYSDDYEDEDWVDTKAEVGPSESASSASANVAHHLAPIPPRRHSARRSDHPAVSGAQVRLVRSHHPRSHHRGAPQPPSPESVGSHEEYVYDPRSQRYYAPGGHAYPQYTPSYSSRGYPGASYVGPPGQQMVPYSGGAPQYPYGAYQVGHGAPGYMQQPGMPPMGHPGPSPYEIMQPPAAAGYFPYPQAPYGVPAQGMPPSAVYQYQHFTPARQASPAQPPAEPAAASKENEGYAELKEMLIKERKEREEREAKDKKDKEEALAKAEQEKKHAEDIATAAAKAAADATTEAEKKAAEKAEEESKKAAEAAAKFQADADAALALAMLPMEERKKPIKFKDAVGRKFSFPFHLCATWEGMEDLIRQAFLHVDVIGPHVAEGHYDLIGPNEQIILPGVWETVIEPDWTITMHMWPMPEPKEEEAVVDVPAKGKGKGGKDKGKSKPAAKKKAAAPAAAASGGDAPPPPPPPPPPPAPTAEGRKKKGGGFSLFGGAKPKAKVDKKKK